MVCVLSLAAIIRRRTRMRKIKKVQPAKTLLQLRVNGETREVATEINKTLLEVLREDLALTGTKHGCELGECGTCAVLVNGQPMLSCLILGVEAEHAEIVTVEGMMLNGQTLLFLMTLREPGSTLFPYHDGVLARVAIRA